jgi:MFS family permease
LWRHPDFLKLWTGQTISELGSRITRDGVPMTAVLVLGAQPSQMGFLTAVGAASTLLFGLLAGVWADRIRRRPIMIAADLARAALLVTIPMAAFLHRLSMPQLYAVVGLAGFCTVFFDVAYQSYLPSLVERENLLEGNSKLAMSSSIAEIAGPSLTGVLVQLITAPIAILFDALSFLVSALSLGLIRKKEPRVEPLSAHHVREETIAGLRFVFRHPLLRPLACFSAQTFFFFGFIGPLYVLYAIRDLRLPPAALGIVIAFGGVGALGSAGLAPRIARRLGIGRTFIVSVVIAVAAYTFLPLAHGAVAMAMGFLVIQQLIGDSALMLFNINERTLRQSVAPDDVLGRVNAAMQLLTLGIYPIGALVCGLVAQNLGVRATLAAAISGIAVASLWLIASPLPKLREAPAQPGAR